MKTPARALLLFIKALARYRLVGPISKDSQKLPEAAFILSLLFGLLALKLLAINPFTEQWT